MVKRIFDLVASFAGLCVLSLIFLIIMLLIVIFDGNTPFFIQERVGKSGRHFQLYKFKTMRPVSGKNKKGFEAGNISRITPLGKVLRRTKLDELPQLLNVLKGDMSLVGPRPEVEEWTLCYPEKWKIVHLVKPGITDYASLEFHREEELLMKHENPDNAYKEIILPRKLALNIEYVKNRTFFGDIKILLRTLKTVWMV